MNEVKELNWSFKSRKFRGYGQKSKKEKICFQEEYVSQSFRSVENTSYLTCNAKLSYGKNAQKNLKIFRLMIFKKQHFIIHGSNHTMLVHFVSGKDKFAYVLRIEITGNYHVVFPKATLFFSCFCSKQGNKHCIVGVHFPW